MRKVIKYLVILLFLCICTPVYAADVNTYVNGKSNIEAGEQFTVTLGVTADNLWGLSGSIGYDSSKLSLVGNSGLNGFTAMVGSGFSLDSAAGKSGSFDILTLTFKATSAFAPGESTTITFGGMTGATDSSRLSVANSSKTITVNIPKSGNNNLSTLKVNGNTVSSFNASNTYYDLGMTEASSIDISAAVEDGKANLSGTGSKTLNYGTNTFYVVVTAENGAQKTYTIVINKKDTRSTNNYLKSLSITNAKINFNKGTTNYNIIVENKVSSINIKATAEDGKASVSGAGNKTLNEYLNTFYVTVTAENGAQRTYRINISRKDKDGNVGALSTNNKLKTLQVVGYDIGFDPEVLKYNLSVDNTVDKVDINAEIMDSNAIMTVKNVDKLKVGENVITIEVVSQSGDKKIYEIVVIRKNDAPVVGIKDVLETIDKTTHTQIEVEIKDDENNISSKILKKLKGKKLELRINKYDNNNVRYVWIINGKGIDKAFDFNTLVKFETTKADKINKLTNYAKVMNLNYAHSGSLPKNTKFKVYVGDMYKDYDKLNLYYFDEENNELVLKAEELEVKKGFVEYKIEHCSEYILTQAKLHEDKKVNVFMILTIIELIIIVLFVILDLLNKNPLSKLFKKNKDNDKVKEKKHKIKIKKKSYKIKEETDTVL